MHCRTCDYALWNLTTRICPECGSGFLPSQYEFVPSSVAFCCPGCDQPYYGLGEKGHLIPRSFECIKCSEQVDMDEMVLRPAEGVDEKRTAVDTVAWHERSKNGFLKSWFKTVIQSMGQPTKLGKASQAHDRIGAAWGFAFLNFLLVFLGYAVTMGGVGVLIFFTARGGSGVGVGAPIMAMVVTSAVITLFIVFGMLLWGLVAHAVLAISGGAPRPMSRTYEAICYSTGVLSLMAVPVVNFCGVQCIALIWWVVAAILIVWKAQGVHGGRAALAVLVFPVICIVLVVGGYIGLVAVAFSSTSSVQAFQSAGSMNDQTDAQTMAIAILLHVAANNGTPPAHAVELVLTDGSITTSSFVGGSTQTMLRDVKLVGYDTIEDVDDATYTEKQQMIASLAAALPAGTTAYRVGDFVFTYPGVDLSQPRGLWIFVMCDDPDVVAASGGSPVIDPVWIGLDDGTVVSYQRNMLGLMLQQQNALRQQYGLKPLPDPLTLGHAVGNGDE